MCALGQNKLLIYFPDKVNTSGAKQPPALPSAAVVVIILYLGTVAAKSLMAQHTLLWLLSFSHHQTAPTQTNVSLCLWAESQSSLQIAGLVPAITSGWKMEGQVWGNSYESFFMWAIQQWHILSITALRGLCGKQISWHFLYLALSTIKWPQETEQGTKGGCESFRGARTES